MKGDQIRKLRETNGWSQSQVAEMLNQALDRKYRSSAISGWELGKNPVPEHVAVFLSELGIAQALPGPSEQQPASGSPGDDGTREDTAPTGDGPQLPLTAISGGAYERLCTELFELVATGVGMVGAATGSEKLKRDGAIIDEDKRALGRAYAKLAQTNETFRRMLENMTTSGAWLEVSLVTGTTVGRIWRNHSEPEEPRGVAAAPVEPFPNAA